MVDLLRDKENAISKIRGLKTRNEKLTVTPVSLTELFFGAFKSGMEEDIQIVENLRHLLEILPYDFESAKETGRQFYNLSKKGRKIGDLDTLTAGIALRHGEFVVTRNLKHFKEIDGLKVEEY
ncbi:MAG: VapC toxin family PIN domain ribonuclease [Candidatus Diapherotrites archaeon]|nr:VapC toxin family PIN domain ribonuclease [Candidatus Diapherotrites archaeon]